MWRVLLVVNIPLLVTTVSLAVLSWQTGDKPWAWIFSAESTLLVAGLLNYIFATRGRS